MKIVASIPIKARSVRVPSKNIRDLLGKPLCQYIMESALQAGLDDVYVNTDSSVVKDLALSLGCKVIDRPSWLAHDSANGNDLLLYDAGLVEADAYIQLFATAPLLRASSISTAAEILRNDTKCDSVLTVNTIHSWFWFDGKPVNYDPRHLPRSQDARPVVRETTGLYGIRREALIAEACRIGRHPRFMEVDSIEGSDIDTESDFWLVETMARRLREGT